MSRQERGKESRAEPNGSRWRLEALGRRVARTVHDIKNLLLVIEGLTERLLVQHEDSAARGDLENIRRATVQAGQAIRKLLEPAHQRTATRVRAVHPNVVLRRAEGLLRSLLGEDILLHLDLAKRVGRIRVDPAQLEQALLNLVFNARNAMPDGGEMLIATDRVELSRGFLALRPGVYTVIRVSDDGAGMDEDALANLFEPFGSRNASQSGMGLGLWLVRTFVTTADGEVRARSESGVGTTIELLLPEVAPASRRRKRAQTPTSRSPSSPPASPRI